MFCSIHFLWKPYQSTIIIQLSQPAHTTSHILDNSVRYETSVVVNLICPRSRCNDMIVTFQAVRNAHCWRGYFADRRPRNHVLRVIRNDMTKSYHVHIYFTRMPSSLRLGNHDGVSHHCPHWRQTTPPSLDDAVEPLDEG